MLKLISLVIVCLLFDESFIRNEGLRSFTLLRRINFDLPVLPVILPCFCGAIDTRKSIDQKDPVSIRDDSYFVVRPCHRKNSHR